MDHMLSIKDRLKLEDELLREGFWENYIEGQNNIAYLKGLKGGLSKRKDMLRNEKRYYCSLIDERINYLKHYSDRQHNLPLKRDPLHSFFCSNSLK